jgi:hypothetical protein
MMSVKGSGQSPSCHPERVYGGNGLCKQCYRVEWNKRPGKSNQDLHRKHLYSLSKEQFEAMFLEQGGLCAICCEREATCVDHCHTTKEVRGLLCAPCNAALGGFKDSPFLMQQATKYLARTFSGAVREITSKLADAFISADPDVSSLVLTDM